MSADSYIIVERRGGDVKVTRWSGGDKSVLSGAQRNPRRAVSPIESVSNGVCGGKAVLANAKAMDTKLGVADRIDYQPVGSGAYKAVFKNAADRSAWLRAHKRVDHNAGYSEPCPGDFRNMYAGEFE